MEILLAPLLETASAVTSFGSAPGDFAALDDASLLAAQRAFAALQRASQPYGAWIAGEIDRRSSREAGLGGLARREGFIDAASLVQSVSGISRVEAAKMVRMGAMLAAVEVAAAPSLDPVLSGAELPDAELSDSEASAPLWQQAIAGAVSRSALTLDAADAICRGLGDVSEAVSAPELATAADALLLVAATVTAEELYRSARRRRDALDSDGVARRQQERRDLRYFFAKKRADGMVVGSFALADEDGALMMSIYDQATHPRRGGPRFVSAPERQRAEALVLDERTTGQLAADELTALLQVGVDADPAAILGNRRPSVRVIVTERTLEAGEGSGRIEGMADSISLETIERVLCSTGMVGVAFDDDGQCVNVGRDQRLFNSRQRIGMAVRDGGCVFGDCERPPSWCEAHPVDYWARDKGKSNIADGVLLCRYHHLLVHDNHWTIHRDADGYWLVPPFSVDPSQTPRSMPSKSAAMHDLARERALSA